MFFKVNKSFIAIFSETKHDFARAMARARAIALLKPKGLVVKQLNNNVKDIYRISVFTF